MPITVKENNKPFAAVITSCILFGMIGIFVKEIRAMDAGSILFYRLFFGFAVILGYLVVSGGIKKIELKQKKFYMLLLGVLNTVTMFTYFSSIKHTGIPVAVLLLYTAPIYVTLLSPLLLKEHVTLRDMLALTLSISGILLAVNPSNISGSTGSENGNYITGILFGLLSGLSYGCSIMTMNYLKETYSAVEQMFWSTAVSLILLLPFGVSVSVPILLVNLKLLIPLGFIATALASLLYLRGVIHIKAQTAAVLSLLEPVSSICFCCMLLGEPVQPNTIGGCLFILSGAALIGYSAPIRLGASEKYFRDMWARFFQPYIPLRPRKL
ncbi:DMT family transporter [Methanosarcina sp. 1.H.T.1A.1]|uniref:DMT family transporter n=1 Tax=Methanosarcina sp. 1.H.T.1A.1 TaxID=1483602 RepID=UPI00064F14CD|nr:DMT family transporter [Methanosarcina sp. 1.H.T.1A.1]